MKVNDENPIKISKRHVENVARRSTISHYQIFVKILLSLKNKFPTHSMRIQVFHLNKTNLRPISWESKSHNLKVLTKHRETALQLFNPEFMYGRQESSYLAFFCHTHDTIKFTTPCIVQFAEGTANTTINENDIHCALARWDGDASARERWCEWRVSPISPRGIDDIRWTHRPRTQCGHGSQQDYQGTHALRFCRTPDESRRRSPGKHTPDTTCNLTSLNSTRIAAHNFYTMMRFTATRGLLLFVECWTDGRIDNFHHIPKGNDIQKVVRQPSD